MTFESAARPGSVPCETQGRPDWTREPIRTHRMRKDAPRPLPVPADSALPKDIETADASLPAGDLSAAESAARAVSQLMRDKQLTAAVKDQFEQAITNADAGKANKEVEYKQKVEALQKKLDGVYTPANLAEIDKRRQSFEAEYLKLPAPIQTEIQKIIAERNACTTRTEQSKCDDRLRKIAPDFVKALLHMEALTEPLRQEKSKMTGDLEEAKRQLECEVQARTVTRILYGIALLQIDAKAGALKQFNDAAKIDPEILCRPGLRYLITSAGGDAKDMIARYKPKGKIIP